MPLSEVPVQHPPVLPITGDNYYYIYCLWVSGSSKGKVEER